MGELMFAMGGVEILVLLLFTGAPLVFWIWDIVDIIKSCFKDDSGKVVWLLVVLLLPFLGLILYLTIGRGQKVTR